MICRAIGIIAGTHTDPCSQPHGHGGECSWAASKLSDDQLRVECERRQWVFGDRLPAELFGACCRLMGHSNGFGWATFGDRVTAVLSAEAERDEWKRRAEMAEARKTGALYDATLRELDEWKRRAEAAERRIASGPSAVASLPPRDTSVAWLDEDLLCEDA